MMCHAQFPVAGYVFLIGTPGRLRKTLLDEDGHQLKVCNLKILILDEADRLLDGGSHTQHLRRIISTLPKGTVECCCLTYAMNCV